VAGIDWINWQRHDWRQTSAANWTLHLYRDIFERFRAQPTPMPIVVLQPDKPALDPGVKNVVQTLHIIYVEGGLLCRELLPEEIANSRETAPVPQLPDWQGDKKLDELRRYDRALALVASLTADDWDNRRTSQYRPYKFPRSRLLNAIEQQYAAARGQGAGGPPAPAAVLRRLERRSWRAGRPDSARSRVSLAAFSPAGIAGALVVAVVGAAAATLLPHVSPADTLFIGLLIAVAALLVLIGVQLVRKNVGPLSWLTQACLWFATTTFLVPTTFPAPARKSGLRWRRWIPSRSWEDRLSRARLVIDQLVAAEGGRTAAEPGTPDRATSDSPGRHSAPDQASVPGDRPTAAISATELAERKRAWQSYLQLRVLALLEDLRVCHRPWALDLRHRKRTFPPLIFLPSATEKNGGLAFLQAVSDVRSRRSEQDPLLILAGVPRQDDIEHPEDAGGSADKDDLKSYTAWASGMRLNQSPSRESAWPWALVYPVTDRGLEPEQTDIIQERARRSWWTRVWSRRSLALIVMLGVVATVLYLGHDSQEEARADEVARLLYCDSSHYLVRSPQSPGQCVGIDTTDSLDFVPADGGVRLNGALPGFALGESGTGAGISLRQLEQLIMAQNRRAEQAPTHITFVYADALTSATNQAGELQAAGAGKQLAGVYAWQYHANAEGTVPVRIDLANGGQDMDSQVVMAQEIVAAARQDPSIVGVIGLGRDTATSPQAVDDLAADDLAVVDPSNSDDALPEDWNYFGLAATNAEEADSLRSVIAHVPDKSAVVFTRQGDDPYSEQQATAGQNMLRSAGFSLIGGSPISYPVTNDRADFEGAAASSPQDHVCGAATRPSVIYLAGRSDDLSGLMSLISDHSGCFAPHVIVLSGDDLAKDELPGAAYNLPSTVTVYYAVPTDVSQTATGSSLDLDLYHALDLSRTPSYADPFFADGGVALAYDAAHALYEAATGTLSDATGSAASRAGVPSYLRCTQITNAATGQVWFSGVRHGIAVVRAIGEGEYAAPKLKILSYTLATGPAAISAPCQSAIS
jgi:hypothetical protein